MVVYRCHYPSTRPFKLSYETLKNESIFDCATIDVCLTYVALTLDALGPVARNVEADAMDLDRRIRLTVMRFRYTAVVVCLGSWLFQINIVGYTPQHTFLRSHNAS